MHRPTRLGQLAALAVIAVASSARIAASCAPFDIVRAFRVADAVFIGKVKVIREVQTGSITDDVSTVATMEVERRWKGAATKRVEVWTCGGGPNICTVGVPFVAGERFLVVASGTPLDTSRCETRPLNAAREDVTWLNTRPRR